MLERFKDNSEILSEVKEGMEDNLKIAKANIDLLKTKKWVEVDNKIHF